ncbi:alkaline phosphatase PafA [Robiginitalea sp. IMCC44478]|uniref:alkaline phosphatase PafA n=1 Tax=Robiginitalea sp. IMCC44478 TaxID=3459122 RepID=UPI00404214D4
MPVPVRVSLLPFLLLFFFATSVNAQVRIVQKGAEWSPTGFSNPPKLVVGIVVDQMRFDYLSRFWQHYEKGGFRRIVGEGFLCRDHHFNYAPTSTGPGHASIYTGTTPTLHGIIGNNWFDKDSGQSVYCAGDPKQQSVGTSGGAGQMSPHRMLTTTITDQLRLHYQMRAKVISISLKDRGAVLPGGHTANAAYWFEGGANAKWISSTYYMEQLPEWVEKFNNSDAGSRYKKVWDTAGDINTYLESGADNTPYEGMFTGEVAAVFPHDLPNLWEANGGFDILRSTPYGNSFTTDFAMQAIENEKLGFDQVPDFLTISYSSTDYIGHRFGVNSKEVQDAYVRLDKDLERLLDFLDKKIGRDNYTVFLTSDHGAVQVPAFLEDQKIPGGYLNTGAFATDIREFMNYRFGTTEIIRGSSNNHVFLDHKLIDNLGLTTEEVAEILRAELLSFDGIQEVYTAEQLVGADLGEGFAGILQNGYNQKRSGDIVILPAPATIDYSRTGSTHGSPYPYDTHVPLLFYGKGIRQGELLRKTYIPDIAPTLALLLGIANPNGTTGQAIWEVLE